MGTLNVQKACEYGMKIARQNTNRYAGKCLTFVGECYKAGGGNFHSSPTHYPDGLLNYCTHRGRNDIPAGNNIPPGAAIWMYGSVSTNQPSHIGLSIGGGQFIDPWKPVAVKTVQHILNNGKYYGWGWLYGNTPSGSYNGMSASSNYTAASANKGPDSTVLRQKVVETAKGQVGTPESQQKSKYKALGYAAPDNGWCCSFVAWVYKQVGVEFPATYACITAADWFSKKGRYKKVGTYTPQPGDCVFFHFSNGHSGANHIEIVTGASDGKVYTVGGNTSMGPGKGDGVAEKTRTGSIVGYGVMEGNYYTTGGADSTVERQEPPHIPQTEKVYTLYEGDKSDKLVDRYALIVESRLFNTTRDITARCGNIILRDDSDAVCTELSFDVIHNNDDRYLENLNVQNGDIVALKNTTTKETIFLGQIQTKNLNGNTVSYGCVDMGFILTKNDIIMQFDNIAFKDALPKIAKRLGIQKVSCPNLISSIYGVKKEKAGDCIKSALDTVTEEVNLKYFVRMKGSNVLTVQSFAEKPIELWRKNTDTTGAFNVLDEISEPSVSWSIEDLANEVIIYSDSDNAVTVKADKTDAESVKRYFRRIHAETISDNETVSAETKADNLLRELTKEKKEVSFSCYNSDKAVAGAMIVLDHYAAGGSYWIKSVEHNISEGTMSLNLMGVT